METTSNPLLWSFVVQAILDFVGSDDKERLICSVLALRFYLDRLKTVSPCPQSLSVS